MAVTPTALETRIDAAVVAIAAESWATAENELLQAATIMAGMPDGTSAGSTVDWDRRAIADMLKDVRSKRRGAIGIRITKFKNVTTSASL